jgi:hypothetical protein
MGDLRKIAEQHSTTSLCSAITKAEFSAFGLLCEQDLGHHALVLVIQQMTMEYGHAFDDGVGRVQDDIN